MHRLAGLRQPLPKNEAVQRPEDQPLGATRCGGNDADVLRLEAVFADVREGLGAGMDVQGPHGVSA